MILNVEGEILQVYRTKRGPYSLMVAVPRKTGDGKDLVTVFTMSDKYRGGQQYKGVISVSVKMGYEDGVKFDPKQ